MKKNKTVVRQGDVLIVPVSSIPSGLKRTKSKNGVVTLAFGEVTGHHHSFESWGGGEGGVVGFADEEDSLPSFITVKKASTLKHQEHNPIVIDKGNYRIVRQVEYTPAELVSVKD